MAIALFMSSMILDRSGCHLCKTVGPNAARRRQSLARARVFPPRLSFVTMLIVLLMTLVVVADAAGAFQEIEANAIVGSTGFTITGAAALDYSGTSVSGAGDVNGDGIADMVIGAYQADPVVGGVERTDAGIVYVVFGRNIPAGYASFSDNFDLATFSSPSPLGFRILGAAAGDYCGFSVSAAGDVNGDGVGDIIIGAYNAAPPPIGGSVARPAAGISYVVFGSYSNFGDYMFQIDLLSFTGMSPLGFRILGEANSDQSGYAVSGAGDINNDGVDDILIGAQGYDPVVSGTTRSGAGAVYVIFGVDVGVTFTTFTEFELFSLNTPSTAGMRILGASPGDKLGYSLSAVGDVNGDMIADILIGAPYARAPNLDVNTDRVNSGISYVIFGVVLPPGTAVPQIDLVNLAINNNIGFCIFGAANSDLSGSAVSGLGDVNGDNKKDFIVGAWGGDPPPLGGTPRLNAGISYIIFGRSSADSGDIDLATTRTDVKYGLRILGAVQDDNSGRAVGPAGDYNVDGFGDILIGASKASPPTVNSVSRATAGIAYVIFGRIVPTGGPAFTDVDLSLFSVPSRAGFRILGRKTTDQLGFSVRGAGDINKDGYSDMLVSALQYDTPLGGNAGATYVLYGTPPAPTSQPSVQPSSQPSAQPSKQPLARPSAQPSSRPSRQPTSQPTRQPSAQPSEQPTSKPSSQPSRRPSGQPSRQPTSVPSSQPQGRPTSQPSTQPSRRPTTQPSRQPTAQPSSMPSGQPSGQPSNQPSARPTAQPSGRPSSQPSRQPTSQPSAQPSGNPSTQPSSQPSRQPSGQPSTQPSSQPSSRPSSQPSNRPSGQPSARPTQQPFAAPTSVPSGSPTGRPSVLPTGQPSSLPSALPSGQPSTQPSAVPSGQPSTAPSSQPSCKPSVRPSAQPSRTPSSQPTCIPSRQPSGKPTSQPTSQPSEEPSEGPTSRPSVQPSAQPTALPSSVPSSQPSSQPSSRPSFAPSGQPSGQPAGRPSSQPSAVPTVVPSTQPSAAPSGQPSRRPSAQPTSQPAARPSSQPSSLPTSVPSSQPSRQPSTTPTAQPSSSPSARPTFAPTGEWAVVLNETSLLTKVSYPDGRVWVCGGDPTHNGTVCVLADKPTGQVNSRYRFAWDSVVSVLSTSKEIVTGNNVVINGQTLVGAQTMSDVATCVATSVHAQCHVKSFHDTRFLAASYVPYPNKVVYVGFHNVYTSITILDVATSAAQSYHYTAFNMKALTLSQVQSPPYFVGAFVAGTTVRATATPVNYIVAGMVRTDGGILSAMALMPQSGEILNSVDLVNVMALDVSGPDSFIAGGLQLSFDLHMSAYILRVNALYNTVQHCQRYRSAIEFGGRRALTESTVSQSVTRGVVLVNTFLFIIIDHTHNNVTYLTVLKTRAADGAILKQVHVSSPNGTSLHCTDFTSAGLLLSVACSMSTTGKQFRQSVLFLADQDLTFAVLPADFKRSERDVFQAENVPFKRQVLSITKTSVMTETSTYDFTTDNAGPTLRPSAAPSYVPSSQPSSAPSAQPSSSPTAAPTVSPQPTSQPSSASPTNTHKPSAVPTVLPTKVPTIAPTVRPTLLPSVIPSARPTALSSVSPSTNPSVSPTVRPTRTPSSKPTGRRSTVQPTVQPSMEAVSADASDSANDTPKYVVGVSVGGGIFLLILLYGYYHHERQKVIDEDLAARKKEYFARLAELAMLQRAEQAEVERREADQLAAKRATKAELKALKLLQKTEENALRKASTRAQRKSERSDHRVGRGAGAVGQPVPCVVEPLSPHVLRSTSTGGSSTNISSLHASEMSAAFYAERSGHSSFDSVVSGGSQYEAGSEESWFEELHTPRPRSASEHSEVSTGDESEVGFDDESAESRRHQQKIKGGGVYILPAEFTCYLRKD